MNRFCRAAALMAVLGLLSAAGQALGQVTQEVAGAGALDWSARVITATGMGVPPGPNIPEAARQVAALESARQDALGRLLHTLEAANINSETTVRSYLMDHAELAAQVRRVLKGFREVGEPRHLSDLSVEIDIEVPMSGDLLDLLLPETGGGQPVSTAPVYVCPTCGQPWPADKPLPPEALQWPTSPEVPGAETHTGLIVDARELGAQPAMAPRVLNEDGKEICSAAFVDREYALSQGVFGYAKDVEEAKADKRVGSNPLVVKALRTSGTRRADLVVSNSDASLIHGESEHLSFLKKCSVVVVL